MIRGLIDGHYGMQIKLRDGDAFGEVADELNELSRQLSEKHPRK
jgi:signal transduction histidine kinase